MRKAALALSILFSCHFAFKADAEVALINDGRGHGFLFHYGSDCFLILPAHVHAGDLRVKVQGQQPLQRGHATINLQRIDELDLSLANLRISGNFTCGPDWFDLAETINKPFKNTLSLTRVERENTVSKTPMHILATTATRIEARILSGFEDREIFQGTSGAILFDNQRAIGMALEASSETDASFLRMSRIVTAVSGAKGFPLNRPVTATFDTEIKPVLSPQTLETTERQTFGTYVPTIEKIEPIQIEGLSNE